MSKRKIYRKIILSTKQFCTQAKVKDSFLNPDFNIMIKGKLVNIL